MFRSISKYLGIYTLFISTFSLLNILFSYYFNFLLNIKSYLVCFFVSFSLGMLFIYLQNKAVEKINFFEKLLLVIFGYFYFPLLIAIPYYFSIYDVNFINAYFESISGFSSTGFTIFNNIKDIDETFLIWRSGSQWFGGLYFLFSLFLLSGSSKGKPRHNILDFESANIIEIKKQYTKVIIIYSLLTIIIFLSLSYSGIRLFEGFNLSLSIISAGGFLPTNALTDIIKLSNQQTILSFCMLIPLFNLYLIYNMFLFRKKLHNNLEDLYLLIFLLFILIFTYAFFNHIFEFNLIFFGIISSLSNIGIGLDKDFSSLSVLFLILAIIGGSSFSTTSGLKFIRIYILSKFSLEEIYSIVKPHYVSNKTLFLSKYKINHEEVKNCFLTVIFFIISFFILSCILSLSETNFKDSLTLSILTLTNTVNSTNFNLDNVTFFQMTLGPKFSLILFMIIGRVELLSFLVLLKKYFQK